MDRSLCKEEAKKDKYLFIQEIGRGVCLSPCDFDRERKTNQEGYIYIRKMK